MPDADRRPAADPEGVELAALLDHACMAILAARQAGRAVTELRVHPAVRAAIADLRRAELDRGSELMVLGLRVVAASHLAPQECALGSGPGGGEDG